MCDKYIMSTPGKLDVASKFSFHFDNNYLCGYIQDFGSHEVILFVCFSLMILLLRFSSCSLSLVLHMEE